ncbi:cytidylyltransferase domain-containing protein [Methanosarcina sp. WWM596]|uniref:cytidylyltransferase domain-containing protein n=1 Tax=Methanosarcina sp. WWM596 TaxID=1434103 RepID=UPI000615B2A4|nr:glycosyltransferase family protein [Methanosarcina sp. WWM596]AKB18836.1 Spore coat polysaccharide biosynthesis protein spsF [Methanosarcina sp. WWM596]
MKNIVGIVQARTGSTRLPNKVIKKIGKKTVLETLLCRIEKVDLINRLIVATTTKKEDDIIEIISLKNGFNVFRGSEENVLDRYYKTAKEYNAEIIVRITADNPLTDSDLMQDIVNYLLNNNCDYVSSKEVILGTGSEVFTFEALEDAWLNSKEKFQKEHVTPYIRENDKKFKVAYVNPVEVLKREDIRLTIDTPEDLKLYSELYNYLGDLSLVSINTIINFMDSNPEIKRINQHVKQRYYKQ